MVMKSYLKSGMEKDNMVKIGMMIGDRYEILEKIGTGGMSDVYKAKCHKLNRFVAVKVLKQEFSENANFVSKFRIEAQAAAGLMHPNIVNVYDVGEEEGIYYIVMELVEGITLKKYIEKKARLSYKEAVSIAIQVSMGIEAAHNNHIIHRDIKPQNIIISKDGKVKVTDFGIAKAATSNTITSNVMGSVHYTSPEQARGGYSDEKSDIYSLGITMFEMLTGRVPFNGETTVAIAIKHIQEDMPSPKEYVSEIPTSVESIVLKCCQKSADRRYQNMQELTADLKQSLMNPDEDFVVFNQSEDEDGSTKMISDEEMDEIKKSTAYQPSGNTDYHEEGMRLKSEVMDEYVDEEYDSESYESEEKTSDRITTIIAIVLGIVICIGIIFFAFKLFGSDDNGDQDISHEIANPIISEESSEENNTESQSQTQGEKLVTIKDMTGLNVDDAVKRLEDMGLVVLTEYEEHDTIDEGLVIGMSAKPEEQVEEGSVITVYASYGKKGVAVPDVINMTWDDANRTLGKAELIANKVEAYSDMIPEGIVMDQTPEEGSKVAKESVVTLTVSKGKEDVTIRVPNLVGYTEQDGTVLAIESGLQIGSVARIFSDEMEEGLICYQSYSQGSFVEPGTKIDIKVSLGKQASTYKYNSSIEGPTVAEAPDYIAGSDVAMKLVTDDGAVLLDTKINSFPQSVNFYGITSAGGTLSMTYTVIIPGNQEDETGEVQFSENAATIQEKTFTRRIEFVQE